MTARPTRARPTRARSTSSCIGAGIARARSQPVERPTSLASGGATRRRLAERLTAAAAVIVLSTAVTPVGDALAQAAAPTQPPIAAPSPSTEPSSSEAPAPSAAPSSPGTPTPPPTDAPPNGAAPSSSDTPSPSASTAAPDPTTSATPDPTTPAPASIATPVFIGQTPVVSPEGTFTVEFAGPLDLSGDSQVLVTSYRPVATRGEVRNFVTEPRPKRLDQLTAQTATIPRSDAGSYILTIPVEEIDVDAGHLQLKGPGVFPLAIEIADRGLVSPPLITFVEQFGPQAAALTPIGLSVTIAVDAAPGLQRDATTVVDTAGRNRLAILTDILERSPVDLTVALRPELIASLADSADGADRALLERLSRALDGRHRLLSLPYFDVSPSWAVAAEQVSIFRRQLVRGEDTLASLLPGADSDRTTWFAVEPIDTAGLDLLRELDVRQVVVDPGLLPFDRANVSGNSLGALRSLGLGSGDSLPAVVGDAYVAAQLRGPDDNAALRAHYLLTEAVGLQLEAEAAGGFDRSEPGRRALTVTIPDVAEVDPDILIASLTAWTTSPRVRVGLTGRTIATVDRAATATGPSVTLPAPDIAGATELSFQIGRLTAALSSTRSILPSDDKRPARWQRLLEALPATTLDSSVRTSFIEQLDGEMGAVRASLSLDEEETSISLGGRRSKIPLVITNDSATPLKVLVRLSSPKLEFPDGDKLITVDERAQFDVPVLVKSSGRFRVTAQVLTADGTQVLVGDTPITVQATVLTGLAQVVTGAFLLILATWWLTHFSQARRRRKAETAESLLHHPSVSGQI